MPAVSSSKIHPDSMEKYWFLENDCVRLFSALLTWAIAGEGWKLVGRSISLDCFHIQTFCSPHTLLEYTTAVTSLGYCDHEFTIQARGFSHSAGNYNAHAIKRCRNKMYGNIVWRKFKSRVNHIGAAQNILLLVWIPYTALCLSLERE